MNHNDAALHAKVDGMSDKVDDIWRGVYGNGQPGLLTRMARVETKIALFGAMAGGISGTVIALVAAVVT